jgi:hypothetical protein
MANNEAFEKQFSSFVVFLVDLLKDLRSNTSLAEVAFERNSSELKFVFG